MIVWPVAILFFLSVWYLAVVLFLYVGLKNLRTPGNPAGLRFSVIVAARNEETNIEPCLRSLLDQTIPPERFEIIVVDDRSTDRTFVMAEGVARDHPNVSILKIKELPKNIGPKKNAVLRGIERARNSVIVFTDADCRVPPTWLETIDRHFPAGTGLVQGITAYRKVSGMNRVSFGLQAVDFLSHGVVAAGAIGAGLPINSNANNLAIRKEAFQAVNGYGESKDVVSGDDDILLQRIWKQGSWKMRFMADSRGAVETFPTQTLSGVINQRIKWGSVTVHYNLIQTLLLAGVFLFYCGILGSLVAGFLNPSYFGVCTAMFTFKITGELILMWPGTRIFRRKELRPYIVPASFLQLPLVIVGATLGVLGRFTWKDQDFKRKA